MAAPTNTPPTEDIWHVSVDDLLAPLPETARLGGPGPFVINLSTSSAPITLPAKGIVVGQNVHVYQVQRMEDRRPRYRLRLGPFAHEDEADAILKKVRDIYPGALTATVDADDLRAIAKFRAKAEALQPPAEKPAPPPQADTPAVFAPITGQNIPVVRAPLSIPTLSAAVPVLHQAAEPAKRAPSPDTKPMGSPKPAPVAMPALSAMPAASVKPTLPAAPTVSPMPITERNIPVVRAPEAPPAPSAPILRQAERLSKHVPSLETTQTVRALTQLELEGDNASRWFVIQLSVAEDTFDPETVPNLDIFGVYRLYSVAGIDQGRIVHALRLGFFSEETAASAVARYLTPFYDNPTIKRVSAAERDRFAEQSLEPRKDVGATGRHAAIEITGERYVRERRSAQAAAK
jgi:SPOR domain